MKCPNKECELIAPPSYQICPKCGANLVKEQFAPQEVEEVEAISFYVEMSEIKEGEM